MMMYAGISGIFDFIKLCAELGAFGVVVRSRREGSNRPEMLQSSNSFCVSKCTAKKAQNMLKAIQTGVLTNCSPLLTIGFRSARLDYVHSKTFLAVLKASRVEPNSLTAFAVRPASAVRFVGHSVRCKAQRVPRIPGVFLHSIPLCLERRLDFWTLQIILDAQMRL